MQRHGNKLFEIRQSTAQFELGRGPPYVSYHARITEKNVGGGGGGGADPTTRKQSGQRFLVLKLFYCLHRGSNGFITEKSILFQGSRGGPTFSGGGGGQLFPGGFQMLISIENHITCDFPGGCLNPLSPSGSAHGNDI